MAVRRCPSKPRQMAGGGIPRGDALGPPKAQTVSLLDASVSGVKIEVMEPATPLSISDGERILSPGSAL